MTKIQERTLELHRLGIHPIGLGVDVDFEHNIVSQGALQQLAQLACNGCQIDRTLIQGGRPGEAH